MRREERVTVQGPVKEQQPDGMSHGGGGVHVITQAPALPTKCPLHLHSTKNPKDEMLSVH